MMNFLSTYGLFFAEIFTIAVVILIVFAGIVAIIGKGRIKEKEKIEITNLTEKFQNIKKALQSEICSKKELKVFAKKEKEESKLEKKKKKISKNESKKNIEEPPKKRIFVLKFSGDIQALAAENLREEVTAVLTVATPRDEVLVCVESVGGMIPHYGLAASQLKRIRDHHVPLIVAVDKVAASGGYMMACVANKIFAAPFAVLGSIGVIAQLPNFNRLLKKHDIDFEQIMAGEYKRTLTVFGENTTKGRKKFQEEVDEAHGLFKEFVAINRPIVDIDSVATGEHWYGIRAKELKLVDEIITSDEYLLNASEKADLYQVSYVCKKNILEKFNLKASKFLGKILSSTKYF
jgi:serine protease SohB